MKCKICGIRDDVCEHCGKKKMTLTRHHISKGYSATTITLCRECHNIVHNQESKFNKVSPEQRLAIVNKLKKEFLK